jgi:hypothetical protein
VSQAFRNTLAARDWALFLPGVKTGYRISELLSLRMGDVYSNATKDPRVFTGHCH